MTAIAERRRRQTVIGAVVALGLVISASAMFVVGAITLSNSQEGEAVGIDERPREQFPSTPNALLAVEADGELASVAVMTLLPSGQGGSIVPLPVNADVTSGFGDEPLPLAAEFDPADVEGLVVMVEDMLSITLQRAAVVDAALLESLIDPIGTVRAVLPIEEDLDGEPGASAGAQSLRPAEAAELLADPAAADPNLGDAQDAAVWAALASAAPLVTPPEAVPADDFGRPIEPTTVEELVDRLFEGPVGVRSLALAEDQPSNAEDAGAVVIDRRDSSLVFAQVSPALVSTPNPGLKIRVIGSQTAEQLEESDGLFASSAELMVEFIGQMLFLQNNVVSVDTEPTGAPDVTIIEVMNVRYLAQVEDSAVEIFGPAEVRLADRVLEGVDIEVTLGMSFIAREIVRSGDQPDRDDSQGQDDLAGGEGDDGPSGGDGQAGTASVPGSATSTVVDDG